MPVPHTPCDMSGQHELDVPADPTAVQVVNVAIDALVGPEVHPFWRARLGYWGGRGRRTWSTRTVAGRRSGSSRWVW